MTAKELGLQRQHRKEEERRDMLSRMKPSRREKMEPTISYDALGRPAAKEHTGGSS